MKLFVLIMAVLTVSQGALGEEVSVPQSLKINGYFDSYYQYSPQGHMPTTGSGAPYIEGRVFDNLHNQIVLNMVEISVAQKFREVSFRVDLGFGQQIDAMATNGTINSTNGQPTGADTEPTRNVTQAYLAYTPVNLPDLTITVGKFYAFIGLEGFKAKDNWQYSRSFNYNFSPYWHQGIGAKYALVPDQISATLFYINASDGRLSQETNRSPSIGANVNVVPLKDWVVNYNYLGGPESDAANSRRDVHEVNSTYQIHSMWTVAADYTWAEQKNALANGDRGQWWAIDGYVKFQPVDWYYFSPRYEFVDDSDQGVGLSAFSRSGGVKQRIESITLTNAWPMKNGLDLRVEYRSDRSSSDGYFKSSAGTPVRHQDSYTVAALFAF